MTMYNNPMHLLILDNPYKIQESHLISNFPLIDFVYFNLDFNDYQNFINYYLIYFPYDFLHFFRQYLFIDKLKNTHKELLLK